MNKIDIIISLIIGEILAWFFVFMSKVGVVNLPYLYFLPLIMPIVCTIGLYISFIIGKKISIVGQFGRFVLVGALNTAIDFSVLNFLIFLTGITGGLYYSLFKGISAFFSIINSFLWNKFWTFGARDAEKTKEEAPRFLLVTLIGVVLNISVASFVVNYITPINGITPQVWANIGAVAAVFVGFLWNFFGFKFLVFRK